MSEVVLAESPRAFLLRTGCRADTLLGFDETRGVRIAVVEVTHTEFVRGAGGPSVYAAGANPAGAWWLRRDDLLRMQAAVRAAPPWPNERRNLLQREIRDRAAISVNWNSLGALWAMRVGGTPLVGLRGEAKAQPVWDSSTGVHPPPQLGNATARTLPGGVMQYFFPHVPPTAVHYYGRPAGTTV